jgi:hypothetical protein
MNQDHIEKIVELALYGLSIGVAFLVYVTHQ